MKPKSRFPLNMEWIYQEILCILKQIEPMHIDQVVFQDEKHNRLGSLVPAVQTYQSYASDAVHLANLRKSRMTRSFDPEKVGWLILSSEEVRIEKAIMVWV